MGDFFKNVEILCYFGSFLGCFCAVRKLFGVFLTYFENSTEILCYFLSYFLKSSEFGRSPKIREQATTLLASKRKYMLKYDMLTLITSPCPQCPPPRTRGHPGALWRCFPGKNKPAVKITLKLYSRQDDKYRQIQTSTDKHRKAQKSTEKYRKVQKSTEKYKQVQTSTDMYRQVQTSTDKYR